jgi:hypothetical protein
MKGTSATRFRSLRARVAASAVAAVSLLSCAEVQPVGAPLTGGRTELPEAVTVVCDASGTTVATSSARPQRDGVHMVVENRTGRPLGFEVGGTGGDDAPAGRSELVFQIPPGDVTVRCVDPNGSEDVPFSDIAIEDPDGLWTDPGVGCSSSATGEIDYGPGAQGETGNPADLARARMAGRLQPGDQIFPAGYPEAEDPVVIVVRSGRTVAALRYIPAAGGGWLLDQVTTCANF